MYLASHALDAETGRWIMGSALCRRPLTSKHMQQWCGVGDVVVVDGMVVVWVVVWCCGGVVVWCCGKAAPAGNRTPS